MSTRVIPTEYSGTRFRSRLEARWAVFFDALEIEWEYEPEAFQLACGAGYTPDFWVPNLACYAEVKPDGGDFDKAHDLAAEAEVDVLMLEGAPRARAYWLRERSGERDGYFISREGLSYCCLRTARAVLPQMLEAAAVAARRRFWDPTPKLRAA